MIGSIDRLFMNERIRKVLVKVRVPLVAALAVGALASLDAAWIWWGLGVSLFGELIQLWCFANLDKRGTLAARGPYALCRNPMYLGRFFIVGGALAILRCWPLLAVYAVFYWFYMVNRVRREERILEPIFGEPYLEYCANVNRFLPGLPWQGNPVCTWSWRLFGQNHGGWNLLGTLAFWGLALGIASWRPVAWWWPQVENLPGWLFP